ncbi:hypothetical protein HOD38_06185 [archaeon]|nr:hypothetical protein [archaeon]MBT4397826.1 hypothetical protein [archaeon]MBT4441160.1 hypothetical protein [archaeon]
MIEKILVGDDNLIHARRNFPYIPNAEIDFVDNPDEVIARARDYDLVITDLNYTPGGEEGYRVLDELQDLEVRKILWTGNAYETGVKERAESLGAEVLDKPEIGALVGQVVNKAPLKKDGEVLIYYPRDEAGKNGLTKVVHTLFGEEVVVTSDLRSEIETGAYGLVIDTSTLNLFGGGDRAHGTVAHDMKYIELDEVPRVVNVYNLGRIVADIGRIIGDYRKSL